MLFVLITNSKPGHASAEDIHTTTMGAIETLKFLETEGIDKCTCNWPVGALIWINSDILVRIE